MNECYVSPSTRTTFATDHYDTHLRFDQMSKASRGIFGRQG